MSMKLFMNPNDDFFENVSKFWLALTNWMSKNEFSAEFIPAEYSLKNNGKLNEQWNSIYIEQYGKGMPFNIGIFGSANWDEIEKFISLTYNYVIFDDKKVLYEQKINEYLERFDVKFRLSNGEFIEAKILINQPAVKEVLEWIDSYPDAAKAYRSALKKLSDGLYERNAIDDMRLSLESLIRSLTKSTKTLENQIKPLGELLKNKGVPVQVSNMITTMITFYTKYQNDYVKHHDAVNRDDLEIIVNMTANIMKYMKERLA